MNGIVFFISRPLYPKIFTDMHCMSLSVNDQKDRYAPHFGDQGEIPVLLWFSHDV